MTSPSETVLFAVTGMSPAVLTETVWALAHERPAIVPDRIVVLTTKHGADSIRRELFDASGVWEELLDALRRKKAHIADKLRFGDTADDIRVFTAASRSGKTVELDDIRSRSDNIAMADFMIEKLRAFTSNPHCRVIASIAGGRKTMGAVLYACMSLIGRETDRLTHVLVNDPFDNPNLKPKFYFPAQKAAILQNRDGRKHRADHARIELADLPFVPLRNRFEDMAETLGNFTYLVARYSKALRSDSMRKPVVKLNRAEGAVTVDSKRVRLGKRAFLTLWFLLQINKGKIPKPCGQIEAEEPFKSFLASENENPAWVTDKDDIKRELSNIRRAFKKEGIAWMPGLRSKSLILPSFKLL